MTDVLDVAGTIEALASGAVVALPTDTVYGVAASLRHPAAVARLFSIKRRPETRALPVLVDSLDVVAALGVRWDERARRLSDAFWPGPLTVVVEAPPALAAMVGASDATVGFRVPDDDLTLAVLRACGALAVSSANEHGSRPCRSAEELLSTFAASSLDGVLDGGPRDGEASTVVVVEATSWRVARDGAVTAEAIARALGDG